MQGGTNKRTRRVGSDWLTEAEDHLVIHARIDMADWEVREIRPTMIVVDGRRWLLAGRSLGQHDTIRFDLAPWPDARHDLPGRVVTYNEAYVQARDGERAAGQTARRWAPAAILVAPLIGFAWTRSRARFGSTYGVSLRGSVAIAVAMEGFAVAPLVWSSLFVAGRIAPIFPLTLALLCLVDGVARFHFLLGETDNPPGFLEWIVRRPSR